ncbi:hypothetical protein FOL47_000084 [Perkinsus chesapeaki]|uniref:Uncharacterized protein n=1 Tax=Perkinsus chesapeaki TaxID=330153 RepID=A0A7J6N3B9_PERCH|nr:hypothetical protein FOL47_000084 [Perkinsus chesapeaki]
MPVPVSQRKVNSIREDLLCKDRDREAEAMAQLYDIPPTTGYDNVWDLIDEVYSDHLVKGPLRSGIKEIRNTWRKVGFKSNRQRKPSRRRGQGSKEDSNSTTTSGSALGHGSSKPSTTSTKRKRESKVKDPQELPLDAAESQSGLHAKNVALWWCDGCGWNSEKSSDSLECGSCKVQVHKQCAGINWGTEGLCQLCASVAKTEGASLDDMKNFGLELVSERSPCKICNQNFLDCASDSGDVVRIGLYMVAAGCHWAHALCIKYSSQEPSSTCQFKDLCGGLAGASVCCKAPHCQIAAHALCAAFRFRVTPSEPKFTCDSHLAVGSPKASSLEESEASPDSSNSRYHRNKIQLMESPIASRRRRRRPDYEIPKPAEPPRVPLFEPETRREASSPSPPPGGTAAAGNEPTRKSFRGNNIADKIAAALQDPEDAPEEQTRLMQEARVIEQKLHERERKGGYLSLARQFMKFLAKRDSVPRIQLRRYEVDGAYVGMLEPWQLQNEESLKERERLDAKNRRMVTLGDINRDVDDDIPSHDVEATTAPTEGLAIGLNGLPVMPDPTPSERVPPGEGAMKNDIPSPDYVDLMESESEYDGESSDSEATKNRRRAWWET